MTSRFFGGHFKPDRYRRAIILVSTISAVIVGGAVFYGLLALFSATGQVDTAFVMFLTIIATIATAFISRDIANWHLGRKRKTADALEDVSPGTSS